LINERLEKEKVQDQLSVIRKFTPKLGRTSSASNPNLHFLAIFYKPDFKKAETDDQSRWKDAGSACCSLGAGECHQALHR
jgi:hypothetical protein